MSSLTAPGFAATQYALFSSLYALPGKLVAGTSGYIAAAYGYPVFFAMTAAVGIPVVVLCLFVGRAGERSAARTAALAANPAAMADPAGPEDPPDARGGNHPRGPGLAPSDPPAAPAPGPRTRPQT
jgi:PAT family beta-lactamase induction signal transducer AmpG